MGYARHVIAPNLLVPALSIAIDEYRAAIRFLVYADGFCSTAGDGEISDLRSTTQLASRFIDGSRKNSRVYRICERSYRILAEGILDKCSLEFRYNWVPGTHFVFYFDPQKGVVIAPKGALSKDLRCSTADLIRRMGGMWYFDIWVRNHRAPVYECARSITTASDTVLITNLKDLGESWKAGDVMKGGQSKWLNLAYRLESKALTVRPNGMSFLTFYVLDGKTGDLAKDVSWDGFEVEALDGYVPHRRLVVDHGIGHFRAQALGLAVGEVMRIRVNRRNQISIAEITLGVEP